MFALLREKIDRMLPQFIKVHQASVTHNQEESNPEDEYIDIKRNPWQEDLYRLASSRRSICEQERAATDELDNTSRGSQNIKTAASTKAQLSLKDDLAGKDTKKWWEQAIATWNPIDGKNIDSIERQRHPRQAKWFS